MTPLWYILVTLLFLIVSSFGYLLGLLSPHITKWLAQRLQKPTVPPANVTPINTKKTA